MSARKQRWGRFVGVVTIMAEIILASTSNVRGADPAQVGRSVPASDRVPMDRISHHAWNVLLKRYVDQNGMVDYVAWKAAAADRRALDSYLASLSTADLDQPAPRNVQLAYWINAYNAVTVAGILREYPTTSIRNHTAKLFGYNIWKDLPLLVDGRKVSLDQMEHERLRQMKEPRIHFAIVCASRGCPRLLNEAYVADRLDEQLTANALDFFARKTNFRFDARRQTIQLSAILDWFGEDFGSTQESQLKAISPYVPDDAAKAIAGGGAFRVSFLDYNWSLNDQRNELSPR